MRSAFIKASLDQGVLVTLNGDVFAARDLIKKHNQKTDAFTVSHADWLGFVDSRGIQLQYKSNMPHTLSTEFGVSQLKQLTI